MQSLSITACIAYIYSAILNHGNNIYAKSNRSGLFLIASPPVGTATGSAQLLLGSTAALQQLKAKDVQSQEMPLEEEASRHRVVLFGEVPYLSEN